MNISDKAEDIKPDIQFDKDISEYSKMEMHNLMYDIERRYLTLRLDTINLMRDKIKSGNTLSEKDEYDFDSLIRIRNYIFEVQQIVFRAICEGDPDILEEIQCLYEVID